MAPRLSSGRLLALIVVLSVSMMLPFAAFGQTPASAPLPEPSGIQLLMNMLPMFMFVFLIFYFLVLRPQANKIQQHKNLIKALKRGDQVVTSGGIIAKVTSIENDGIQLEIAPNVKVKFEAEHVTRRFDKTPSAKAEKAA